MSIRLEPATRHYDETLQKILKCSAKIFAEKGFHHTSVRDISRATKFVRSVLLLYDERRAALSDPGAMLFNLIAALGAGDGHRRRRAGAHPRLR